MTNRLLVSLDFRAAAVRQRLDALERGPHRHVALQPPPERFDDAASYADALVAQVPSWDGRIVVVTNCAAFGLLADVEAAFDAQGVRLTAAAVDPVTPTTAEVREALGEVLAQLVPGGEVERLTGVEIPPPHVVAASFAGALDPLLVPVERGLRDAFGLAGDAPTGAVPVAGELLERYAAWLQYVVACYAGSRKRAQAPVEELRASDLAAWVDRLEVGPSPTLDTALT